MSQETVLDKLREKVGDLAEDIFVRSAKRIYLDTPPEHTLEVNSYVFQALGGRLATASGVDTRDRIEVLYHYCIDAESQVVTVRTWAWKPEPEIEAVSQIFPGAQFIEREMYDLLGVRFRNHPDPRRLLLADDWPDGVHPLRRTFPKRHAEVPPAEAAEETVRADI